MPDRRREKRSLGVRRAFVAVPLAATFAFLPLGVAGAANGGACGYADWMVTTAPVANQPAVATKAAVAGTRHYVTGIAIATTPVTVVNWSLAVTGLGTLYGASGNDGRAFGPPLRGGANSAVTLTVPAGGVAVSSVASVWGFSIADGTDPACATTVSGSVSTDATLVGTPTVQLSPTPLPVSCSSGCAGSGGGDVTLAGFSGEGDTIATRVVEGFGLVLLFLAIITVLAFRRSRS